jgi:hypothetical protein
MFIVRLFSDCEHGWHGANIDTEDCMSWLIKKFTFAHLKVCTLNQGYTI